MKKLLLIIFPFLFFSSCFSPRIISYSDPNFISKEFRHLAIFAEFNSALDNQRMEERVSRYINKEITTASPGKLLFPPTRDWSESIMKNVLLKNQFDGKLIIRLKSIDENQVLVPAKTTTRVIKSKDESTETKERVSKDSTRSNTRTDSNKDDVEQISTVHRPAHIRTDYFKNFEALLIDIKTDQVAWIGNLTIVGNSLVTFSNIDLISKNIYYDLLDKGHLIEQ